MQTMYDSVDASSIPRYAEYVAGYVDGARSIWSGIDWARFPNAKKLRISTWGPRHLGECLDIELGDSIPSDIPDWTDNAIRRGVTRPTIYCSLSDWALCRSYAEQRPVMWWIAHYTNVEHLPTGADACQWTSSPAFTGGGYDLSVITSRFVDNLGV